jgi:hypothetical protein
LVGGALAGGVLAQEARVLEAGPHHRVMEVMRPSVDASGQTRWEAHHYVELASGLNRWDPNSRQWAPARAVFEATEAGYLVARHTAHQVILSPDPAAAEEAVDFLVPSGDRLRSRPLGLAVLDRATGNSLLLAELQACRLELVSPPTEAVAGGVAGKAAIASVAASACGDTPSRWPWAPRGMAGGRGRAAPRAWLSEPGGA